MTFLALMQTRYFLSFFVILVLTNKCKIGSNGIKQAPVWKLISNDFRVLENFKWPGRNQVLCRTSNLTYYLDGAHTVESIELCKNWFSRLVEPSTKLVNVHIITLFLLT